MAAHRKFASATSCYVVIEMHEQFRPRVLATLSCLLVGETSMREPQPGTPGGDGFQSDDSHLSDVILSRLESRLSRRERAKNLRTSTPCLS